jgi:oligopeptide/dipeptide ABC transporter ATP-binding protein
MTDPGRTDTLLAVEDLSLSFPALRDRRTLVLDRVSFDVGRQETVALVGESGSGKTVTALATMGLNHPAARVEGGRILLEGRDLLAMDEAAKREYRGSRIAMIFQAPKASLNPLVKAGSQIARVVRLHQDVGQKRAEEIAAGLMRSVGINDADRRFHSYPHQLSGGMAQRVMIAMALSSQPDLLIADEPTTGLDVTIQEQIFELLLELKDRLKMSILLITHDLALVAETSDRVAVMHGGHVVETGPVEAVFEEPKHPYTQHLVGSVLRADRRVSVESRPVRSAEGIDFTTPGCRYALKCAHRFAPCVDVRPALLPVGEVAGHVARCHLYDETFAEPRGAGEQRAVSG